MVIMVVTIPGTAEAVNFPVILAYLTYLEWAILIPPLFAGDQFSDNTLVKVSASK